MSDISPEVRAALLAKVKERSVRTESGCMLYYTSRGRNSSKVTVAGKRTQLARLLFLSQSPSTVKKKRLRRRSCCLHKRCIEPAHYYLSPSLRLEIHVTTFDPLTYKDITKTLHIEVH